MEDKDLDRYFKDRSEAFNEAPGEALWAKIEANIEPPAPSDVKGKWLLLGGAFLVMGILSAWLLLDNNAEQPAHTQQEIRVAKDAESALVAVPAIKPDAIQPVNEVAGVKRPTPAPQKYETVAIDEFAEEGQAAKNAVAQPAGIDSNSVPSTTKSIAYTTEHDKGKDAIDITITQKITPAERRNLIKNTVEKNAAYVGRTITINATGYPIYQHTITQGDYSKCGLKADTLSPKLNLRVVTDTVFYDLMQDSATTKTTKFKATPKYGNKQ